MEVKVDFKFVIQGFHDIERIGLSVQRVFLEPLTVDQYRRDNCIVFKFLYGSENLPTSIEINTDENEDRGVVLHVTRAAMPDFIRDFQDILSDAVNIDNINIHISATETQEEITDTLRLHSNFLETLYVQDMLVPNDDNRIIRRYKNDELVVTLYSSGVLLTSTGSIIKTIEFWNRYFEFVHHNGR